jgi:uncharacterized protein (DUF488 family)
MTDTLFTVGYESASLDDFVATLRTAGVEMIIDVREYPLSRKKGFSKNTLHAILEANDIGYIHLKGLGDPKEGRDAARSGDFDSFLRIFRKHMKSKVAQADLKIAIEKAQASVSCLLCYERKPEECHRTIVAQAIAEDTGQRITALGVSDGLARKKKFKPEYPDYAYV